MQGKKRVAFARINRRAETTEGFGARPFRDDMRALAESRETRALFRGREWIAADLKMLPTEDHMIGVLGFTAEEAFRDFDPAAFSWVKGPVRIHEGASERTMVPFAIDLRDDKRWVAFGTTARIQPPAFANGFETALNAAVGKLGLMPTEWEVDLVVGVARVEEWLELHPNVTRFTRIVRFHNPTIKLDRDREEMRALAARTKTETFTTAPARGKLLNIRDNPVFERGLEGLDTGDLDIELEARQGISKATFSTRRIADRTWVEDYGDDLESGMELMLRAVQDYVAEREGGDQGTIL